MEMNRQRLPQRCGLPHARGVNRPGRLARLRLCWRAPCWRHGARSAVPCRNECRHPAAFRWTAQHHGRWAARPRAHGRTWLGAEWSNFSFCTPRIDLPWSAGRRHTCAGEFLSSSGRRSSASTIISLLLPFSFPSAIVQCPSSHSWCELAT